MLDIFFFVFFFNDTATTEIYTLSLHDALPISFRFLSCENPSDDLLVEEGQFAARTGPEVWQACRDKLVSYGPARTADQPRHLLNRHCVTELLHSAPLNSCNRSCSTAGGYPRVSSMDSVLLVPFAKFH